VDFQIVTLAFPIGPAGPSGPSHEESSEMPTSATKSGLKAFFIFYNLIVLTKIIFFNYFESL
jgi:hypothetical protein